MPRAPLTVRAAFAPKRPPRVSQRAAALAAAVAAVGFAAAGDAYAQGAQPAPKPAASPTPGAAAAKPAPSAPTPPSAPMNPQVAQLLAAARTWEDKNRPDMARGLVQKALLISPQQPEALALLGEVELKSNQPDAANKILQQLRQIAPNHPATQNLADAYRVATTGKVDVATIRMLSTAGKNEEAAQRLQQLFPRGAPQGDLAGFYYKILSGTPAGRARALDDLHARLRQNPNDLSLQLILADLLTDNWRTRVEGLTLLYSVYQQPESNRTAALDLWHRTLTYAQRGDPQYYIWWKRYLQEVPGDPQAQSVVAEYEKSGINEQTAARLAQSGGGAPAIETPEQRAARARAAQGEKIGEQGLARMREGRHDEARALFERALALDPGDAGKWRGLIATATLWGTIAKANTANSQGKPAEGETLARDALKLDPANVYAAHALTAALIAQQKWPEAEAVARPLATGPKPDIDALRDLVTILRATHRDAEIDPLIAGVAPRVAGSQTQLAKMRAEVLSLQAEQSIAEKNNSAALAKLEDAVRLTPDDPWLRYSLARLYSSLRLPALGRAVMEDGLKTAPSPEMHYASALYFNYSLDDIDAANGQIAQIPPDARTPSMRELAGNIAAQRQVRDARMLVAQGREDEARALLTQAEADAQGDPQMLATIGREWIALGDADHGLALVKNWLDAHPDDPAIGVRLRYGELLAAANRDDALAGWLAESRTLPGVTDEQRASFDDQALRLSLRQVDRQLDEGDVRGARRTLAAVPAAQHADRRWLLAQADIDETAGNYRAGIRDAQQVLATQPDDAEARLTLARMYERMGQRAKATALVHEVLEDAPDDDIDTRLSIARRFTAEGREDDAAAVVDPLRERYPQRSDLTAQSGRIEQSRGHYGEAAALYREAGAQERAEGAQPGVDGLTSVGRAMQQLNDRRQPQIATEVVQSNLTGDAGISRLNSTEVPLYVRIPNGYSGHYFFHADSVYLNAGTLPGGSFDDAYQYGKIAALGNAGLGPMRKDATGVALAAGYEFSGANDSWRADVGSTPLGFPIASVLGGFQYRHDFPNASLSFDASRRPMTSSLVSYAGGVDPVTGQKWGGVVRNSITVRGAQDVWKGSVFASVGIGVLTGDNVQDNREFRVRGGFDYPVYQTPNQRVSTGLIGNFWKYQRNEHFYTFGNGGYYSPQSYTSVSIPIDWTGRYQKLSWELGGSVGMSFTREDESPYYPTSAALQDAAEQQLSAARLGSPFFGGGGSGGGFSYTVLAAAEYRITPHWIVGGRLQIDRSRDYAPNVAMVWLRYFFNSQHGPVPFPPTPVRRYSDY
ncbi:cellulose synthase subunit BcsC-related outer membrane protein [Paraburkholderia caballeronis]|uniref:cellulose synthase subunit BcsC-related outer membrane protein n=1 Tax=Paraburkholderia caballeronis TaxID=416943 RepID=UPI0010654C7D|nr:cellulose synthase subunit BcsC-related outer membrane protein [Paraburkholderia caballeronis]TDV19437.1 tetratricopeptide repeat protein [Paraburkholderia caballeronis]TDV22037.1 tetratricopeptide repeat protein [Paraburkholderia caballeronis]TDV28941.1 tetratricopeptide repeat protein [Paraburkholderia caballeronis]